MIDCTDGYLVWLERNMAEISNATSCIVNCITKGKVHGVNETMQARSAPPLMARMLTVKEDENIFEMRMTKKQKELSQETTYLWGLVSPHETPRATFPSLK